VKRVLTALMYGIVAALLAWPQQPSASRVEPIAIHVFPAGREPGMLAYDSGSTPHPQGPQSIAFAGPETIVISDYIRERWIWVSTAGQLITEEEYPEPFADGLIDIADDGTLLAYSEGGAEVLRQTADSGYEEVYRFDSQDTAYSRRELLPEPYSFADDWLIGELGDANRYFVVDLTDSDNARYHGSSMAAEAIRERQTRGQGLWVDDDGYLFLDERLFTRNVATFHEYFSRDRFNERSYTSLETSPAFVPRGLRLAGIDAAGYWYWHSNYYVFVLGPGGNLVRRLDIPEPYVFDRSGLAPDPDGNLWFLKWSRDGHTLYRIENTWSTPTTGAAETSETTAQIAQSGPPQARLSVPARLTGTPVGLRETATTGAPVLAYLASTAEVQVLDQTEPERIGILTAPWYRVATADGTEGWVYGIFLEMTE